LRDGFLNTSSSLLLLVVSSKTIAGFAIVFFEVAKERFAKLRNDIGGHYQEKSAKYAVDSMTAGTQGRFDIEVDGEGADTKLHFATALVTRLLVKDMPADGEATDEKLHAYIGALFREIFNGWNHVIKAVHVVSAAYLAPRFIKGRAEFFMDSPSPPGTALIDAAQRLGLEKPRVTAAPARRAVPPSVCGRRPSPRRR
jgi:hypothetical protein